MTEEIDPAGGDGEDGEDVEKAGGGMRTVAPGRLRRLALDIAPVRDYPDYRRLFIGELVSTVGSQMTLVTIPIEVYDRTHSSLYVGLIGLATFVPLVLLGLIGGAIADAVDRRRMMLWTQAALATCSALLVLQSAAGVRSVWPLFVLAGANGGLFALDSPARRAITPRLIPLDQIPAATALSQVMFNIGVVTGPLLAGQIAAHLGFTWSYAIDLVTFSAALYAVVRLPSLRPEGGGTRASAASVLEGFRFLRSRRNVLMTFLVDINAMVFGMPRALFPALAATRFGGGRATAGLLYAAPAMGAVVGALFGGWFGRIRRQGLAVLVAVAAWGFAIVGFGLVHLLWLGVVCLAIAGASDMVSAVFRTAILTAATPDDMRGRLSGVFIVVVAGGPRLGDLEAGAMAAAAGPQFSVISGGVACVVGVIALAAMVPSFARYDARSPEP